MGVRSTYLRLRPLYIAPMSDCECRILRWIHVVTHQSKELFNLRSVRSDWESCRNPPRAAWESKVLEMLSSSRATVVCRLVVFDDLC